MTNPAQNWGFDPNNPLQGATVCPHCRGVARSEIDAEMRYVCGVCGGPRVRVGGDAKLSGAEVEHLQFADKLRKKRAGYRSGGGVSIVLGVLLLLAAAVAGMVGGASLTSAAVTAALAIPLVMLAMWTLRRAGQLSEQMKTSVDQAWKHAAQDVTAAAGGPLSAKELRRLLPLPLADSENLLAQLEVEDMLSSRVTEAGELVFEAPMVRKRVAVDGAQPQAHADPLEAKFKQLEAEQEQAANEEAQRIAEQRRFR